MDAVVLQVTGRSRYVVERDSPIQFEPGSVSRQHIPADAETDAGKSLEVMGGASRHPGPSYVDELGKLDHIFAARVFAQGNPAFKGSEESVISNKRVFSVAAHAEPTAQRDLFKWKQAVVAQLEIQSPQDLPPS